MQPDDHEDDGDDDRSAGPDRGTRTRHDAVDGVQAMLKWLIGVIPCDRRAGGRRDRLLGSAQLTAVERLRDGAGLAAVVVSVLVLNARLLLYGSTLVPHWRGTSFSSRGAAAHITVDPILRRQQAQL